MNTYDKTTGVGKGRQDASQEPANEAQIPIDGLRQVIEMLRIADPAFRESLLRRLAARDSKLALTLREELANI